MPLARTLDYLQHFDFAQQALLAAVLMATASSLLSAFVVLKRLAFVGQGISHTAFGGIGLAAVMGLGAVGSEVVIFIFCILSALLIGGMSRARSGREDAAIGIVLVASMAAGSILMKLRQALPPLWPAYREAMTGAPAPMSFEAALFGSVLSVGWQGVWMALAAVILVGGVTWWYRRPLVFYVFDEPSAPAFGVPVRRIRIVLLMLLAVVVVVGMKLAGVILITAMLILPGAAALQVTRSLRGCIIMSWVVSMIGVLGGLVVSFELDWLGFPTGPSIVLVMVLEFLLAMVIASVRGRRWPSTGAV